jgi:hypothetical protein
MALRRAIKDCFISAQKQSRSLQNSLVRVQTTLKLKLSKADLPLKADVGEGHDGYREQKDGETFYTISAVAMNSWFPRANELQEVIDWLDKRHCLKSPLPKPPTGGSLHWAVSTPSITVAVF